MPDVTRASRGLRLLLLPRIGAMVAVLLAVLAPAVATAQQLTLSVAISMKDAVEDLGKRFVQTRPGVVLGYNFGSSGELQKQIEAGAPVDLFISAAQLQMDELERRGLILPATRRTFARNVLVVVKPADSALDLTKPADLLDDRVKRIVVGNPKTVPAGQYAQESLRALGEFGATLMLAGNIPGRTATVPLAIYTATQTGEDAQALVLVGALTALSCVVILAANRLGARAV